MIESADTIIARTLERVKKVTGGDPVILKPKGDIYHRGVRWATVVLLRDGGLSWPAIARTLRWKDHTTAMNAYARAGQDQTASAILAKLSEVAA